MKPRRIFLPFGLDWAQAVAGCLLEIAPGTRPIDLSDTIILSATASAGRKVRCALAKLADDKGTGLLSPAFASPMQWLVPDDDTVASEMECLLGWASVLPNSPNATSDVLFPAIAEWKTTSVRLGVAQILQRIADTLAEAGLEMADLQANEHAALDREKWQALTSLHQRYQQWMHSLGRLDPNSVKISLQAMEQAREKYRRVVVVAVPDLPLLVARALERFQELSGEVWIIVPTPEDSPPAAYDDWGRPIAASWHEWQSRLEDSDILVVPDADQEPSTVCRQVLSGVGRQWGICLADSHLIAEWKSEFESRGWSAYAPEGEVFTRCEMGKFLTAFFAFHQTRSWDALGVLLEFPGFLSLLKKSVDCPPVEILRRFDAIRLNHLFPSLDAAIAYYTAAPESRWQEERAFVQACRALVDAENLTAQAEWLVQAIHEQSPWRADELEAWEEITKPWRNLPEVDGAMRLALCQQQLARTRLYPPHADDAIELGGWLEALWNESATLVISGFTEGSLPAALQAVPFLPDSLRKRLGLRHEEQIFTRDIYLLACLEFARKEKGRLVASLSRFSPSGEPLRPSRLLCLCSDPALPGRIQHLFSDSRGEVGRSPFALPWHLQIPSSRKLPAKLRVTDFATYLKSPFEFYLRRVLKMEPVPADKQEMDVRDVGTLVHDVLDVFGKDAAIRDSQNPDEIEVFLRNKLEAIFLSQFGRNAPVAARVQKEQLAARWHQVALQQVELRKEGWRILHTEAELPGREEEFLLATFGISSRVDRIDLHDDGRLRIIDYKTGRKTPEEAYFRKYREPFPFPEAQAYDEPARGWYDCWIDLQLPLYRALAEKKWPDTRIESGYFLVSEEPNLTGYHTLHLDDATYAKALRCAEQIAELIGSGVFWPPNSRYHSMEFDGLYLGLPAEEVVSPASRLHLQGIRS